MPDKIVIVLEQTEQGADMEMQFPEDENWAEKKENEVLLVMAKQFVEIMNKVGGEFQVTER